MAKPKYTKSENAKFKNLQIHLKILEERTKHLKWVIKRRKRTGQYNMSDPKKILAKIKKAKLNVADAGFI